MACCLPTCAQGSPAAVAELVESGVLGWDSWLLLGAVVHMWRVLALLVYPPRVYKARATQVCLSLDTPLGRRSVGALSAWLARRVHWFAQKYALQLLGEMIVISWV